MTELATFKQIEAAGKAFIKALEKQPEQSNYTLTN